MNRERTASTIHHFLTERKAIRNSIATSALILACLFLTGQAQAQPATAPTAEEQACYKAAQGKVAYNQAGDKNWSIGNLTKLCQNTVDANATIACFQREIQSHNSWEKGIAACQRVISSPASKRNTVTTTSETKMPGAARDIDAKNGEVWIISTNAVGNDYEIHKLAGSRWTTIGGAARRIAVDTSGNPWIVNSAGVIYRRVNAMWQPVPGPNGATAVDIAISNSNEVWIVMSDGAVARWTGSGWTTLIALNAKQVIYTPNPDQFLIVDQSGKKFVRESPTSWVAGKDTTGLAEKYIEYAVEPNSTKVGINSSISTKWGIDSSFNIWLLATTTGVPKPPIVANPSPVIPAANPSPVVPATNASPVAPRSNGTPEAERTITFKNEAGYAAKLTVVYFVTETIAGGAQVPMAKSLSTSSISLGVSKSLVIPRNTAKGMPIRVVIEGVGTTKGKVLETTVPEAFNGTLCFKAWGTVFDAKGGNCQ
ncbi:MAG: hypothetical protein JNM09_06655 [Blastocatellia bacterium]|nr:hypothetical protein [Blastocatellia bacterium]